MIRVVLYSNKPEEIRCIRRLLTAYSVRNSWADCRVDTGSDMENLEIGQETVDIMIADASDPRAVECLKAHKRAYPPLLVFPIAGPEVPPTVYVCPEIMPCGLFWRPVSEQSAQPVIEQMMAQIHDRTVPQSQNNFRIAGKQKVQDVPFQSILFFEAREKKLALRMRDQEVVFGGTLSQLEEQLPPEFIRCHKSFIVNKRHILSVDRTEGIIHLANRMELPISRSYKKAFWEVFHNDG